MTRFGYAATTYFAVMVIGGLSFIHIAPKLIWNASASTPIGLYSSIDHRRSKQRSGRRGAPNRAGHVRPSGYLPAASAA